MGVKSAIIRVLSSLALLVLLVDVNTVCKFILHQPKLPEGAMKFRRF